MTSRTAPPTSLPMEAPRGKTPRRYVGRPATAYWKRFGPPPPLPVLPYPGPFGSARANVAELFVARDALLGDQRLENPLARGDHGVRVFFAGEAHLVHHGEQAADDA